MELRDEDQDAESDDPTEITQPAQISFAPPSNVQPTARVYPTPFKRHRRLKSSISQIHNAWSTALNSRIGRADNARFLEHFRYIVVASQLLNEYLDQGALPPPSQPEHALDGAAESSGLPSVSTSLFGAAATAGVAFASVLLIHWARNDLGPGFNRTRSLSVLLIFAVVAILGYFYLRRQWLKFLRRNVVLEVTGLTADWQAFEVSAISALSLIQEVELVSKGYRLATPLPPASRIEDNATSRRCVRVRKSLYKAYTNVSAQCTSAVDVLRTLIDEDDLERYFEVYDINSADAQEALNPTTLDILEQDPESLKSLRVLSSRAGVLRRVTLSCLMALEADGGKSDFYRWRTATEAMSSVSTAVGTSAEKIQQCLSEMTEIATPASPSPSRPAKDRLRGQVRKISMLSSGIKTLQAKMQVLREETNRSIEQSADLVDLGPNLMAQYDSVGEDLKELMSAWEAGKCALQTNITKQERRISLASSVGFRSPVSSLGGLTAVDEDGGPAEALKALTGEATSNRSSMATASEDEVFEAIAMSRQRSVLTREERISKMHEERERQAIFRTQRDANTSMLRELESVINLRPKKPGIARITSV